MYGEEVRYVLNVPEMVSLNKRQTMHHVLRVGPRYLYVFPEGAAK